MRVLMLSKALVRAEYQRKLAALATQPGIERLVAVTPPAWSEPGGNVLRLEERSGPNAAYQLRVEPIRFNGNFHLFYWPGLPRLLREVRPDVVHVDEEPYNLATALACWQAARFGARPLFFTWQNLLRRYPPPFSLFERVVFRRSRYALAGNAEAVDVLRAKGWRGPTAVVPQFGIDPDVFSPGARPKDGVVRFGFLGRLTEEKGLDVLLDAASKLRGDWRLCLVGDGPQRAALQAQAERLGMADRVRWQATVPSSEVPERLRQLDVVVQPSRTRPNWKEQFGRTLVEGMATEAAVIGTVSGEIPHVVGDAGLLVPEGDIAALADAMQRLLDDADLRRDLGRRGRERVLARFTHRRIAEATADVYRAMMAGR